MRGGNGARTGHRCFCNTRSTANSPDCPYHEKGKERRSSRNGTIGQAGRPPVHPVRRAHRCTQSPGRRQPNLDPSRTSYHRQDRRSPEMETVRTPASHIRTSCINPRVPASSRRPPTTPRRRTTVITVAHRLPRDLDPGCRPSPEAKRLVKFFCWNDFSSDLGCSSRTSAWRGCCCCEISTTASSGGSSRRHHGPRLFYR
ncbi:hypothetical protein L226DRAFT_40267 [Lentinus tigrinus ALCF2SS1-7]|uniref:Uncharacterized protein n=1 Tax=Lentinus tigrinus ALCF2SS1-6 TaxID=1328759 RepID=A0A5C2SLH5_9APHY|nr:hypothetical protein L227DRAFT_261594 [Lentinus tigrinus ALCF2SS1-6]RPD82899.1 hypothetical protein L226DRAFT_40267 [Lentinus tigrinus ALCF2SS1-7]